VWQGKELEDEKEVEEGKEVKDVKAGKRTDEAVRQQIEVRRSQLILRRAEGQRNCTKGQKCIPVPLRGGRPEIHARTKLGGDGFVGGGWVD
jgi:hypothetical protein